MYPALSPWAYGRNRTWSLIALLRAFMPDKYPMRGSFELSRTGRGSIEIVECLNAAREKLTGPRAAPNPLKASPMTSWPENLLGRGKAQVGRISVKTVADTG